MNRVNNREKYISVRNLTVRYGAKEVIQNANFEVFSNDFIGIIGPNGGGKTSLIKAVLKLIPYDGCIEYSTALISDKKPNIGYLPQITDFDRSFPITAREVVLSGLQRKRGFWRFYTHDDKVIASRLMEQIGILPLAQASIGELSGGEFQRVMLCRALISDPRLLVLDEPTNFVDNRFEKELYELLREVNERMAIIMISHDLGTISSYIKTIMCVNHSVHLHPSNLITPEQLTNYDCPIQLLYHGDIPHQVLKHH